MADSIDYSAQQELLKMDEQEHNDLLAEIANKVHKVITNNRSSKTRFQKRIKAFCEKNNEYRQKFQKWERIANTITRYRMNDMGAPFEGYIWDGSHRFWRPRIFSPMAWVVQYFEWNPFNLFDKPTEPPTQSERLMCEYAVLAAIHDTCLKDLPACDKLYKTDNEEDIPALSPLTRLAEFHEGKDIRDNIQRALDHVETDIKEEKLDDSNNDAYIPFSKAIELSSGLLTRKKLEKAIKEGDPVKVRSKKPSLKRKTVHIQDVLSLIERLSSSADVAERAAEMFGTYKKELFNKQSPPDLD